jgi:hypothetical protein
VLTALHDRTYSLDRLRESLRVKRLAIDAASWYRSATNPSDRACRHLLSGNGGADAREGAINGWTWTGLTPVDAVIWVLAEVQIATDAFVPGRYGGQARLTGRVDADS